MELKELLNHMNWFFTGLGLASLGFYFLDDGKPYLLPPAMFISVFGVLSIFIRNRAILVIGFMLATATAIINIITGTPVLTDEEALILYASHLFLEGQNPYTHNLIDAYRIYHIPFQVITGTTSECFEPVMYVYPPLSFVLTAVAHGTAPLDLAFGVLGFIYAFYRRVETLYLSSFFLYHELPADFASGQMLNLVAYVLAFIAVFEARLRFLLLGLSADVKQFALLNAILLLKFEEHKLRRITEFAVPLVLSMLPFLSFQLFYSIAVMTQPVVQQGISFSLLTSFGVPIPSYVYTLSQLMLFVAMLLTLKDKRLAWGLPGLLWLFSYRDLGYFNFYFTLQYVEWMKEVAKK